MKNRSIGGLIVIIRIVVVCYYYTTGAHGLHADGVR